MPRVPRWDPDHALQNIRRQDGTSRNAGHCSRGCETLLWEPEDRTSRNAGHCSRGCETLLWEVGGMCDSVWEAGGMCDSVWEAGGMCDSVWEA